MSNCNIEKMKFDSVEVIERNRKIYGGNALVFLLSAMCLFLVWVINSDHATPFAIGCVGCLVLAYGCAKLYVPYLEIGTAEYAALTSHKSNAVVNAYIDAVKQAGRDFIIRSEFAAVLNYVNCVLPVRAAKAALFNRGAATVNKEAIDVPEIASASDVKDVCEK